MRIAEENLTFYVPPRQIKSFIFEAAQERLAEIRANGAKAQACRREVREGSKAVDEKSKQSSYQKMSYRASLKREVENAVNFFSHVS